MNIFLKRISLYTILISSISLGIFFASSYLFTKYESNDFSASVIDKLNNIKKNEKNRIIFMGGSNVSFSIDSKLIENEMSRKVVNSGLVYNTGYIYQLNFLKKFARKGDLVIYIPEFSNYEGEGSLGTSFLYKCLMFENHIFKLMGFKNQKKFIIRATNFHFNLISSILFPKEITKTELNIDREKGFNSYGDIVKHLDEESKITKVRSYRVLDSLNVSNEFMDLVLDLKKILNNKGVDFLIMFPPYSKNFITTNFLNDTREIARSYDFIIGDLEDNLFEDSLFYDSPYHTLRDARKIRTQNIIDLLKLK